MSNGLHHVAPPSFFPTAKELSSGIQWFKEHPILAAAAATAVSVITYLHTAEDVDVDVNGLLVHDDDDDDDLDRRRGATRPTLPRRHTSSPSILTTAVDASAPRVSPPPALRKPGSEGKMSPAAVTWVDEHGGSLTEVFEHLSVASDSDDHDRYPDLDAPLRSAPVARPMRPPTPRRSGPVVHDDDAHVTGHWMGSLGVPSPQLATPSRDTTESPQWGWYVPITPPQDPLSSTAAAPPRGSSMRPPTAPRSAAVAAIDTAVHADSSNVSSAMRRSVSGRIKTAM